MDLSRKNALFVCYAWLVLVLVIIIMIIFYDSSPDENDDRNKTWNIIYILVTIIVLAAVGGAIILFVAVSRNRFARYRLTYRCARNSDFNVLELPSGLKLPPEIWCQVIGHLQTRDLKSIALVSEQFKDTAIPLLWSKPLFRKTISMEKFGGLSLGVHCIKELRLSSFMLYSLTDYTAFSLNVNITGNKYEHHKIELIFN